MAPTDTYDEQPAWVPPPGPTIVGNVDRASAREQPSGDIEALVEGWVLHPDRPFERLDVEVAGGVRIAAQKVIRPDVASRLAEVPHAAGSGFRLRFSLPAGSPLSLTLMLTGHFADSASITTCLNVMLQHDAPEDVETAIQSAGTSPQARALALSRQLIEERQRLSLRLFLDSGATLSFAPPAVPQVSAILVAHNRADCTFAALRSLREQEGVPFELILVDNCSTDETPQLLRRLGGARVLAQSRNTHYIAACNFGAAAAAGEYLLFLNSDVTLLPGALAAAVASIRLEPRVGVVGGRIMHPHGRLQEAGCRIFRDGSTAGVGVGGDPLAPPYGERREADYCSGAFLLTPRALFLELRGYAQEFSPAYYEDVDYCVRAKLAGYKVIYEPRVNLFHMESASFVDGLAARALMDTNREAFKSRHTRFLATLPDVQAAQKSVQSAASNGSPTILVIDDFLPAPELGQGMPRSLLLLRCLIDRGLRIYVQPMNPGTAGQEEFLKSLSPSIDVLPACGRDGLSSVVGRLRGILDGIIVSRPYNMEALRPVIERLRSPRGEIPVIYDAEAIFAVRQLLQTQIERKLVFTPDEVAAIIRPELEVAHGAAAVLCVSDREARVFRQFGISNVHVLGYGLTPKPTPRPFEERRGFLTVGPMLDTRSPNSDAVRWFLNEVQPELRQREETFDTQFNVAGLCKDAELQQRARSPQGRFALLGLVADLLPVYDRHRVFVAPARYAAGIPLKVIEAAAYGLPVVCSSLVAEQLGWERNREILAADSPADFAANCRRLATDPGLWAAQREAALVRVRRDYAPELFSAALRTVLERFIPAVTGASSVTVSPLASRPPDPVIAGLLS